MIYNLLPGHHPTRARILVRSHHQYITRAPSFKSLLLRTGIIIHRLHALHHETQTLTDQITPAVLVLPLLEEKDLGSIVLHHMPPLSAIIVNTMIVDHEGILVAHHHGVPALYHVPLPHPIPVVL